MALCGLAAASPQPSRTININGRTSCTNVRLLSIERQEHSCSVVIVIYPTSPPDRKRNVEYNMGCIERTEQHRDVCHVFGSHAIALAEQCQDKAQFFCRIH